MKESFSQELYSMLHVRRDVTFYVKVNAISSGVSILPLCAVFIVKVFYTFVAVCTVVSNYSYRCLLYEWHRYDIYVL